MPARVARVVVTFLWIDEPIVGVKVVVAVIRLWATQALLARQPDPHAISLVEGKLPPIFPYLATLWQVSVRSVRSAR